MAAKPTTTNLEEMVKDLIEKNQINTFIEHYNKVSGPRKDKLRIEKYSPYIYVILMNKPKLDKINKKEVLLVKVGFTQQSVKKGTDNRMEEVKKQIYDMLKTEYKISDDNKPDVSILFKFLIHALDTRRIHDIEKSIREKVGFPLPKEIAKEWGLPVHTEWALTTQDYIDEIKGEVARLIADEKVISTKIFKSEPGNSKRCNLPRKLGMTEEELTEKLEELPFPLEKAEKKIKEKTPATLEKSQPADKSSTPEEKQTKQTTSTSGTAARGRRKKLSATDNSPREDLSEKVEDMSLKEGESSSMKTTATLEKPQSAGESSTSDASAKYTPGKTCSAPKGRGKKPSDK